MSSATLEHPDSRTAQQLPPKKPIPMSRLVRVELTKMFDTRSGFWLMASIGIASLIATIATIAFAPHSELTYDSFGAAVGVPMTIVLPIIAILSVTSEWSQRSGLSTFTLVPHRGRVIGAKAICAVGIGVAAMIVAMGIGAIGNVVGTAVVGVDTRWNVSVLSLLSITLASVLGMLIGFMLGVLIRNSPGAIVGYFVYAFVLPGLFGVLANFQGWFENIHAWVDFNYATSALYDTMSGTNWAQIGVSGLVWLIIPLAIGLRLVLRSEVK